VAAGPSDLNEEFVRSLPDEGPVVMVNLVRFREALARRIRLGVGRLRAVQQGGHPAPQAGRGTILWAGHVEGVALVISARDAGTGGGRAVSITSRLPVDGDVTRVRRRQPRSRKRRRGPRHPGREPDVLEVHTGMSVLARRGRTYVAVAAAKPGREGSRQLGVPEVAVTTRGDRDVRREEPSRYGLPPSPTWSPDPPGNYTLRAVKAGQERAHG